MAGLTKQHFNSIAEIINKFIVQYSETFGLTDEINNKLFKDLVEPLSDYFKTQNPLFNENQFKKVCLK